MAGWSYYVNAPWAIPCPIKVAWRVSMALGLGNFTVAELSKMLGLAGGTIKKALYRLRDRRTVRIVGSVKLGRGKTRRARWVWGLR